MKTRAEAVALINHQLTEDTKVFKGCWHYGVQELKDLMDFIYEGTPVNKQEEIRENSP